jgi:hypothetical protein
MRYGSQPNRGLAGHGPAPGLHGGSLSIFPRWLPYLFSTAFVACLAAALASAWVAGGRMAAIVPFLLAVLLIALVWESGLGAAAASGDAPRQTQTPWPAISRRRLRSYAALISARCVSACGKLPRCSPRGPSCSAYRPRWLA